MNRLLKFTAVFCLSIMVSVVAGAQTNVLIWHKDKGTVDANMHDEPLLPLLKSIAGQSGWRVYVEAGTAVDTSTKFKNLPTGDALKMLLGDLNFALVPKNGSPWQLYVFRTTMKNATHLVSAKTSKHVANQLMVKVKPGTDIDALAKSLGAKVVGKMDKYGVYLLQFDDADSTDDALSKLQMDSDVQAVDYNYYFDPPPTAQQIGSAPVGQLSLQLSPPTASGKTIVGLIDTDVESLGADLNQFMLKQVSVADGTPSDSTITHGTAMAYTILQAAANSTQSSATSFQILPVDVYGSSETTTSWYVAVGVQAAVNGGATVLNLSLGSQGDSSVLDSVMAQASSSYGIVSFAATGNTPIDSPYYPAADPGVIPITAIGQPGQLASYANVWPEPTMMALPGTGLVYYGGQPWIVTGTSTSTAEATGVFAGNLANGGNSTQILNAMGKKFTVPGY